MMSPLTVPCLSEGNSVLPEENSNFDLIVLLGGKEIPKQANWPLSLECLDKEIASSNTLLQYFLQYFSNSFASIIRRIKLPLCTNVMIPHLNEIIR